MYFFNLEDLKEQYSFLENTNFQINNGWIKIIHKMCKQIKALQDNYKEEFTISFTQIKQKFGTLRIYYVLNTGISKELKAIINSIVQKAENDSSIICEKCGEVGTLRKDSYWIHTFCDFCEESYKLKNNDKK